MGAVLAAVVVFPAIRTRESEVQRAMAHTVEVVVAAKDIPLGAKLEPDAVKRMCCNFGGGGPGFGDNAFCSDWLVDDGVLCELLSASNSLMIRENTGNFRDFAGPGAEL
jgi:hypothetical protein